MAMNPVKGNMYGFVTHTKNYIKGKCSHDCPYCYMKIWKQKPLRLDEKEFKEDLGKDNFIFVGSSTDMFANDVPEEWILEVLDHIGNYPSNKYLFQTKNPKRLNEFQFPYHSIIAITLETNRDYALGNAPYRMNRVKDFAQFNGKKMITIEPIMDFDIIPFVYWIQDLKPELVAIGADSKNHNLPEPSPDKINALIKELKKFTEVKLKDNLKRLIKKA